MPITNSSTLTDCAFEICTAMHHLGHKFVLVGGSAATFYCPKVYQSMDLDFCMLITFAGEKEAEAIANLGYEKRGSTYHHPNSPYSVDFMHEFVFIDNEQITEFNTVMRGDQLLHVIKPEDSIRDRLLHFGAASKDYSALKAAAGVLNQTQANLESVRNWCDSYFGPDQKIYDDLIGLANILSHSQNPRKTT